MSNNLEANVLRLGAEVRDLSKERDALKEHIKYLEVELNCETGRWERALEENARLNAENEELHKDYEALADEHTKLTERNKTLKAEVDALKLGSLLTAVDVLQFINLKAEVERLRKVGDAMAREISTLSPIDDYSSGIIKAWNAAKKGKQP